MSETKRQKLQDFDSDQVLKAIHSVMSGGEVREILRLKEKIRTQAEVITRLENLLQVRMARANPSAIPEGFITAKNAYVGAVLDDGYGNPLTIKQFGTKGWIDESDELHEWGYGNTWKIFTPIPTTEKGL